VIVYRAAESARERLKRCLRDTDDAEALLLQTIKLPTDGVEFAVGGN